VKIAWRWANLGYIHAMYAHGPSIREIARRASHDRKTIRKYLRRDQLPRYSPRPAVPSKPDQLKDYLRARMALRRVLATLRFETGPAT